MKGRSCKAHRRDEGPQMYEPMTFIEEGGKKITAKNVGEDPTPMSTK